MVSHATQTKPVHAPILIIGSGPAGYTAAIYAARAMLAPVLIAGHEPGGQLMITTDVENYPGFAKAVEGPWLMDQMRQQAEHVGAKLVADTVTGADLHAAPFRLTCDSGAIYSCDALIIATGASAKWMGTPSEEKYRGYGVSACATCDGFFYRGKEVVVVGGGNTAVEEALYLANIAARVTVVHRRDSFRAERILQERLFAHPKIDIRWNTVIEEILGEDDPQKVTGVRLKNTDTDLSETQRADGVFIAIGHRPASDLFTGQITLKPNGTIQTLPGSTQTSIPGVFAAGDVADDVYRQAVTAAGLGCMAALEAERYVSEKALQLQAAQ